MTGVAFHMVSALAATGRVGVTAVGDAPAGARSLLYQARSVLDNESGAGPGGARIEMIRA